MLNLKAKSGYTPHMGVYKEEAEEIRHTLESKEIYNERKETIKRVLADCKEQYNLRYTCLLSLKKNQHQATLIFACYNLKKVARWNFIP